MGETRYILCMGPAFYIGMIIQPYCVNTNNIKFFSHMFSDCESLIYVNYLGSEEDKLERGVEC